MPSSKVKDISGNRYGKLLVMAFAETNQVGKAIWIVKCDCGRVTRAPGVQLRNGNTKSCGCANGKTGLSPKERLLRDITAEPNSGCWLWLGATQRCESGALYGCMSVGGASRLVHRVAYEAFRGPIPKGLVLDHKCRVTLCVNPGHLRPMTIYENAALGNPNAWQRAKTHCPKGHAYQGDNLYVSTKGTRQCRACTREAGRKRDAKAKANRLRPAAAFH